MCSDISIEKKSFERSDVQAYINYLHEIIKRMARNSSNCKNWLITIIVALIAIDLSKDSKLTNVWVCYIPTFLFMIVDCYYWGFERYFRDIQENFIQSVKENHFESELYLFNRDKSCKTFCNTITALKSFSIYFFYGIILIGITIFLLFS